MTCLLQVYRNALTHNIYKIEGMIKKCPTYVQEYQC